MPSSAGENGQFDRNSDSSLPGDINGTNIPSTAGTSQTQGSSQGTTANADGEMANTTAGTDAQGGMPGQQSGTQAGSDQAGTSNTAGNSDNDGGMSTTVGVQTPGLPGLEPFPTGGLPGGTGGSGTDVLGSGSQGNGTQNTGTGTTGAGSVAGAGSGTDPFETGTFGGGAGSQGDQPLGTEDGTGTIAGSTRGEGEFPGEESGAGNGDNPFGDLANGRGDQPMTQAERQAALDARLDESIAVFDGMILGEREAAQGVENENGGGGAGGNAGGTMGSGTQQNGAGSQGNGSGGGAPVIVASSPNRSSGGGVMPDLGRNRDGDFDNSNMPAAPIPDDIPSGNDDDVVARQLREAAMSETDPELRERLWNEYRNYTGLPIPEDSDSGV